MSNKIEPDNVTAGVDELHQRLVDLDRDEELVGVERRWAAVYRSLSSRNSGYLSTRIEGKFPGDVRLVVESQEGHWGKWSRSWSVTVTCAAMRTGWGRYLVERTDLRALTRGWLGEDVTVDMRTKSLRDDEWYEYHFEPHTSWSSVFARAAWEAWTHHMVGRALVDLSGGEFCVCQGCGCCGCAFVGCGCHGSQRLCEQ